MADGLRKVLVIGSGPIVIGQAAEFDYAGTQACKSLKEEGVTTVLVNSNPATIMTDEGIADRVYIEPLTVDVMDRVLDRERPDGILPTLGGQTGLNLAVDIADAGLLEKYGVRLLGTPLDTIKKAEDRELFRSMLIEIGEHQPPSLTVSSMDEAWKAVESMGLPLVVRPAYTLVRHRRRDGPHDGRRGDSGGRRSGRQSHKSGAPGAFPRRVEGNRI